MSTKPIKVDQILFKASNWTQKLLLLFFRLNWGWQFWQAGQGKFNNHHKVTEFFSSLHLPFPDWTAWLVAFVECVGGLCLMAGFASRPVGLILTINMIVAYMSVESDRQAMFNFFKNQTPFLQADPFFFLLTALLVFCFGAGSISADAILAKWAKRKKHKE